MWILLFSQQLRVSVTFPNTGNTDVLRTAFGILAQRGSTAASRTIDCAEAFRLSYVEDIDLCFKNIQVSALLKSCGAIRRLALFQSCDVEEW